MNSQQAQDDAFVGLCLGLLVFSSIPITSTATMYLGIFLLVIVWAQATGKLQGHITP